MPKNKKMKTISKSLLFFLCLFLLASCQSKESKMIQFAAEEANKLCPQQIDIMTNLEKVEFKSPKTIQYYFTLDLNQTNTDIENLKNGLKTNIEYNIANNKIMDQLKELDPVFEYNYKDQNGKDLFQLTYTPDEYRAEGFGAAQVLTTDNVLKLLQESAELQNQQLPRAINEVLSMSQVNAISPRTIEYVYRYTVDNSKLDTAFLASQQMKTELIASVKNESREQMLKDNDVTFRFVYLDKNGNNLRAIEVAPADYK